METLKSYQSCRDWRFTLFWFYQETLNIGTGTGSNINPTQPLKPNFNWIKIYDKHELKKANIWTFSYMIYADNEQTKTLLLFVIGWLLSTTTHIVPVLDLRKKCLKGMAYVFRDQFIWRFENGILENPNIRDSWVNPTNWP